MDLLNSHLESTKDHAEERKAQLKKSFEIMKRFELMIIHHPLDVYIIFIQGGHKKTRPDFLRDLFLKIQEISSDPIKYIYLNISVFHVRV